jgi:hypothetical protein
MDEPVYIDSKTFENIKSPDEILFNLPDVLFKDSILIDDQPIQE